MSLRDDLRRHGALSAARAICGARGVRDVEELRGPSRYRLVALARHELMGWLRRNVPGLSYPDIGRLLDRDHTTVISGVRKAGALAARDPRVAARQGIGRDAAPDAVVTTRSVLLDGREVRQESRDWGETWRDAP